MAGHRKSKVQLIDLPIKPGAPIFHRLFNPKELNMLISGGGEDGLGSVDVEDLKLYVRYSGGYREDSTTVKLFWKVGTLSFFHCYHWVPPSARFQFNSLVYPAQVLSACPAVVLSLSDLLRSSALSRLPRPGPL